MYVARAISFFGRGKQGKLTDHHHFSAYLFHTEVHHPVSIVEDAERCNLFHQPVGVLRCVGIGHAKENQHPVFNATFLRIINGDGGVGDALYNDFHGSLDTWFATKLRIILGKFLLLVEIIIDELSFRCPNNICKCLNVRLFYLFYAFQTLD